MLLAVSTWCELSKDLSLFQPFSENKIYFHLYWRLFMPCDDDQLEVEVYSLTYCLSYIFPFKNHDLFEFWAVNHFITATLTFYFSNISFHCKIKATEHLDYPSTFFWKAISVLPLTDLRLFKVLCPFFNQLPRGINTPAAAVCPHIKARWIIWRQEVTGSEGRGGRGETAWWRTASETPVNTSTAGHSHSALLTTM